VQEYTRRAGKRESAACRVLDPELFFPIGKTGVAIAESSEPRRSATAAPVRQRCLTFALDTHQVYGIWGGYDEEERRILHRQRRKA
jgi:WhiB family transcriptional regulator, redox-sensing transcriptional regulator